MASVLRFGPDSSKISALMQSYFQSGNINFLIGSGASCPALATAGNIEATIDEHLMLGEDNEADIAALDFIEDLVSKSGQIGRDDASAEINATTQNYVEFLRAIDQILFGRKNSLLSRQANVFSTNYDLFIEAAAAKVPSLILNDGFKRASIFGTDFPFAPECYLDRTYRSGTVYSQASEIPTINLLKLHGSLTWKRTGDELVYQTAAPARLPDDQRADADRVRAKLQDYFLVLPNLRKFNTTLMDRVYYGLLRLYANALERENALLICFGFSFQDAHILDITRRALRNPTAQVAIIAYNDASVDQYQNSFGDSRNVAILAPGDGEVNDFAKLRSLITSLLPKDS